MPVFPVPPGVRPLTAAGPTLLVVVDTEEEFDWDAPFDPGSTSVANIEHQALAQHVFDAHGVAPTYVVDYPVARAPDAVAVLKGFLDAGRCDIGAHLHPWVNPPAEETVDRYHSYTCNLPHELARRKLQVLTDAIAESFGRRPVVYKAGRYGVDAFTPAMLRELGYAADTSVVPHTDFRDDGGPDFRGLPEQPFVAEAGLLEVPLSVQFVGRTAGAGPRLYPLLERGWRMHLPGLAARLGLLERLRLSPEGHTLEEMVRQTRAALARGQHYLILTYHSSSLMPGGSPYARTRRDRDQLVRTLTEYLDFFMALPAATATTIRALVESHAAGGSPDRACFASPR